MEVRAIRKPLENLQEGQHAGLLLHRYLQQHDDTHEGAKQLYEQAQNMSISPVYRLAFRRWQGALEQLPNVRLFTATAVSPIAVGLGNESVLEVGLTVHHTYGAPIIPGSALKGLCRRGALWLKQEGKFRDEADEVFKVLFGYSEQSGQASAGYITFWDAWYDPDSADGKPFHRDVITVHHQQYYSNGEAFPTDFDDPNPVPFLVVKPRARFLFALQAPDEAWGVFAQKLLEWCLQNLGVGAKTNAGYGFLVPDKHDEKPASSAPASAAAQSPTVGNREVWRDVTVAYNPSQRNLQVQRQHQGRTQGASADEARTRVLLAALPVSARDRLTQGKRRLLADVEVEVSGNRRTIVKITPKE